LVIPSNPVMNRFEGKVKPLRCYIEQNIQENISLSTIRDFLLPKLMSGEIRVKEAEKMMEKAI
ncbi:MAG: restriction endonuclease subunit S, partial [Waterburya sp.]